MPQGPAPLPVACERPRQCRAHDCFRGIYKPDRPDFRPHYGTYLAAWPIRQAFGHDKRSVRINTEAAGGYRFSIVPVRAL